ncbi:MAG: GNAT family N-acetyltransferase [Patescibacteria group bacterium]|nr:GNAT family N-acetyltransferase [Patescibacteria group bacterium]
MSDKDSICLIAEDDGKPVAYLSSGPKEDIGRRGTYFEVNDMGVIPSHRSKGIGKMLMERCFSEAKARGFEKISVRVYSSNVKAIEFYRRSGFKDLEVGLERPL